MRQRQHMPHPQQQQVPGNLWSWLLQELHLRLADASARHLGV